MTCEIRRATAAQLDILAELARQLWEHHAPEELRQEYADLIGQKEAALFVAYEGDRAIGFAQCQLRVDYVEGTSTSPVGYLEGIFVRPECRGRGIARALLQACETWAAAQGCAEFASDCELNNEVSRRFHERVGFTEANRLICFTKPLGR